MSSELPPGKRELEEGSSSEDEGRERKRPRQIGHMLHDRAWWDDKIDEQEDIIHKLEHDVPLKKDASVEEHVASNVLQESGKDAALDYARQHLQHLIRRGYEDTEQQYVKGSNVLEPMREYYENVLRQSYAEQGIRHNNQSLRALIMLNRIRAVTKERYREMMIHKEDKIPSDIIKQLSPHIKRLEALYVGAQEGIGKHMTKENPNYEEAVKVFREMRDILVQNNHLRNPNGMPMFGQLYNNEQSGTVYWFPRENNRIFQFSAAVPQQPQLRSIHKDLDANEYVFSIEGNPDLRIR